MRTLSLIRVRRGRRRGAAAVEFAVTAPVLFRVAFGVMEVGRAFMVQQLLANAARDGARSAMLEGSTVESVQAAVASYLEGSAVRNVRVEVSPQPLIVAQGGDPVTVTVTVPFESVSWLAPPKYFRDVGLSATVTMRREVFTSTTADPVNTVEIL